MEEIFSKIQSPDDIKKLSIEEMEELADFLRKRIISTISSTGGHLASSLGTVELSIALHYVFDAPDDKIIWDVSHQCYAHKLLTGRMDRFDTIRQYKGISGFTKPQESCYDCFGAGHSSTSISAALGIAKARDHRRENFDVIAVIGDGALTGGMAYEGMNNAGHLNANMIVVLNDNEMSISKNVGALARYLSKLRMEPRYVKMREELRHLVRQIPKFGRSMLKTAEEIEEKLTYLLLPGVFFESLGFTYLGPFDGHDLETLINTFYRAKKMKGPKFIHIITQKGKGYLPAEQDSTRWHGAIPFDVHTGSGIESQEKEIPAYTEIFCNTLLKLAKNDPRIVAITAAMPDGTGLVPFAEQFPHRFYDVGIAESHAVTFAAGLAVGGMKPVVAIYSTFIQRAYDQIIHDVCLQKLPVVLALDRGGLVGEDGPTHHGVFDYSFLRSMPEMIIMAPKDENEMQHMLKSAFDYNAPVAVRYPRGMGIGIHMDPAEEWKTLPLGKGEVMSTGNDVAILAVGSMVYPSILAAEHLNNFGISASVVNMRFIKPLDTELILDMAEKTKHIVTVEENTVRGGFGSAVQEVIHENNIKDCLIQTIGVPDMFIEQGHMNVLREKLGLTAEGIVEQVKQGKLAAD
jgi:1-deoxy-D-xylulose-5-phosphate synthase